MSEAKVSKSFIRKVYKLKTIDESIPSLYNSGTRQEFEILFETIVGSHAHGTNIEGSDIDIKGVFLQPLKDRLLHGACDQIIIDNDTVYYELTRFLNLLTIANPTILEMLFVPKRCIQYMGYDWKDTFTDDVKKKFLTQKCRGAYTGYAHQQIHKAKGLDKKMNWENDGYFSVQKDVLDFCYHINPHLGNTQPVKELLGIRRGVYRKHKNYVLTKLQHTVNCYAAYYLPDNKGMIGEDSNELRTGSVPKNIQPSFIMTFNHGAYKEHQKKHKEYKIWLKERNKQRYVDVNNHGQKIDGKNLLHCIRLIDTGMEIIKTGWLHVERKNANELIDIRKGRKNLEEILEMAKEKVKGLEDAFRASNLPKSVSGKLIKNIKIKFYKL